MAEPMLTAPAKFSSSYLKLSRALKHADELRAAVEAYIASAPLHFAWRPVPWDEKFAAVHPAGAHLIGLMPRVRIPIPVTLAPIIGDVVHNLRSALDVMMFDLISSSVGPEEHVGISFPFWKTPEAKAKAMKCVTNHPGLAALVEAWEPCPGGRSRLYALHEMWNTDKHRKLIPTMNGVEFCESRALLGHLLGDEPLISPFPARKQVRDGQPFIIQEAGDNAPPLGQPVPCVVGLALEGADSIKGRDLIHEVQAQCRTVRCVLESFETGEAPTYLPASPPSPVSVGPDQWMCPPTMTRKEINEWIDEQLNSRG